MNLAHSQFIPWNGPVASTVRSPRAARGSLPSEVYSDLLSPPAPNPFFLGNDVTL